eukprot:CAMPEP_0202693976 /NCGR_PEP_ID=MMETSP1385-20130828/7961_1 /ASSEMBLY_ACC=CAM_ASM_000861 /TAXON_ID=933848 /ORGANISM="Elphidium margaritaceum" /LENGTH=914 /DNA_ID=CAMNT_0049349743 /DNA_START=22 /DNA_END=2766 /DNA_ORIENTATION=+
MPVRLCVGDPVLVFLNKQEKVHGIGLIKYIGFIQGHAMTEYVGVELLEKCDNGHDGIINGFQYFTCKASHGIHVRLTNVIRKLTATEIMLKMQEVISMFKQKLDQYSSAVFQRDDYIEKLKIAHREAKRLLKRTNEKVMALTHEIRSIKLKWSREQKQQKQKQQQQQEGVSGGAAAQHVHTYSHQSDHSHSHSHSHNTSSHSHSNLEHIAAVIRVESLDSPDDIDHIDSNGSAAKSRSHTRNLSAQLKLDTIDDTNALDTTLATPSADIPLLIDQLVQSMDGGRRQSFNTVRSTPVTPITPVTPSIDYASDAESAHMDFRLKHDEHSVVRHSLASTSTQKESLERDRERDMYLHANKAKQKSKKLYGKSFPDTKVVRTGTQKRKSYAQAKSYKREESLSVADAENTTSPQTPDSMEMSPSPSPNVHAPRHRKQTSGTVDTAALSHTLSPETNSPDTAYEDATEEEEEEESQGDVQQLDAQDKTPYWSGSSSEESQRTRRTYDEDDDDASESERSEYSAATPINPHPRKSKSKAKTKTKKKSKSKTKTKNLGVNASGSGSALHGSGGNKNKKHKIPSHATHTHSHRSVSKKRSVTVEAPPPHSRSSHHKRRHSSNKKPQRSSVTLKDRSATPPTNVNGAYMAAQQQQQQQQQSMGPAPPHVAHAQRRPSQPGAAAPQQPQSQQIVYYAVPVPQLDSWMQQRQQQQQHPHQHQHQHQHQQQSQAARRPSPPHAPQNLVNLQQMQSMKNNPYLDQQYLPQFQNYNAAAAAAEFNHVADYADYGAPIQPLQHYAMQQQQQAPPATLTQTQSQSQLPMKYAAPRHRTYFSDHGINYNQTAAVAQSQPPTSQVQVVNAAAASNSAVAASKQTGGKVQVAPRGGRRSYHLNAQKKHIQMFAVNKNGNNNNAANSYYVCDEM